MSDLNQVLLKQIELRTTSECVSSHVVNDEELGAFQARLLATGLVGGRRELLGLLAEVTNADPFDPSIPDFPASRIADLSNLLPSAMVLKHGIFAIGRARNVIDIVLPDPRDHKLTTELERHTGCQVRPFVCDIEGLGLAIERYYGKLDRDRELATWETEQARVQRVLTGVEDGHVFASMTDLVGRASRVIAGHEARYRSEPELLADIACEPELIRLLQEILNQAVAGTCSDIHFEPERDGLRIRVRRDGRLATQHLLPATFAPLVAARLKLMAGLPLVQQTGPLDGRIAYATVFNHLVEYRLSVVPSLHGDNIVLRVIERGARPPKLSELGLIDTAQAQLERALQRRSGMVLVTGPTGSGKSTTVAAALSSICDDTRHLISVEDPIERELAGVTQIPLDESAGTGHAEVLRSLLRQDPDVIALGEIRDKPTADLGIRAALTGHLVLSTLHTNDAASTVARLLDLGLEPFTLAAALRLVVAQRLLRQLCDCKQRLDQLPTTIDPALASILDPKRDLLHGPGPGCRRCSGTGYRGMVAAFEILSVDEAMEELILQRASATEIRRHCRNHGVASLRDDAVAKLRAGLVSWEEVAALDT